MGDDVKCQASCDETAGAVCIRIWCTDTLVNLLWRPSMSNAPQDGERWKEVNFKVQNRPISPSLYQSALEPHIQHVNHRVASCMYEEQQGWMKTALGVWEPLWSCCPVLATSLIDLLDAGGRKGDDQVDHEEYDDNYEFRWKWWVISEWLDWTLQNHLVSPNCSVQVQHALAYIIEYILHTTYTADQARRGTNS